MTKDKYPLLSAIRKIAFSRYQPSGLEGSSADVQTEGPGLPEMVGRFGVPLYAGVRLTNAFIPRPPAGQPRLSLKKMNLSPGQLSNISIAGDLPYAATSVILAATLDKQRMISGGRRHGQALGYENPSLALRARARI